MTIKRVNQYSVDRARNYVRGSLQAHGEQCILLSMFHPQDDANRCPNCTNDIYSGGSNGCYICYGTGFYGGVKQARRVWGLFADRKRTERAGQRGVWAPDSREIQTEPFPELLEHDYVVRVRQWDINNIPLELEGYYGVGEVTQDSLRTGGRFGQFRGDVVGQRAPVNKQQSNIAITHYPIVGRVFSDVTFSPAILSYETLIGDGTRTTFTVNHDLDTEDITIRVYNTGTGEEVTADPAIVDSDNITVAFGFAPRTAQFRVVVVGTAASSPRPTPQAPPDVKVIYLPQTLKHVALLGDGVTRLFPIHHRLGTTKIVTSVYRVSTGAEVTADVIRVDANTITVGFDENDDPPTVGEYEVVIKA